MSERAVSDSPAVAVLQPNAKLGLQRGKLLRQVPLADCRWPLGCPDRLLGKRVADLADTDHVIGFSQNLDPRWPVFGVKAKVSIVLAEPTAIAAVLQKQVRHHATRFHRVLSYNKALLNDLPNSLFFPYGSTWVNDWKTRDLTKTKMCSLIASSKRSQPGHILRHQVADWVQANSLEIDLLGQGYAPFKDKGDGLAAYRYSVVIENVQEENCFTEKLVDAVLCESVPIYWGCPNIERFMDTSGMILCHSFDDLQNALNSMSEADYHDRLQELKTAKPQAASYADFFERAARAVLEDRPVP